jgi:CheY-like chemotaxis protein
MARGAGRTVLVVEDDRDLRSLVELALTSAGYRVETATDGRAALAQVDREMPGLILLDMKMPGMNGWEFADAFRARFDASAPIVVLTAAREAAERAADVRADGHLGKPFDLDDLFAIVGRFVPPVA